MPPFLVAFVFSSVVFFLKSSRTVDDVMISVSAHTFLRFCPLVDGCCFTCSRRISSKFFQAYGKNEGSYLYPITTLKYSVRSVFAQYAICNMLNTYKIWINSSCREQRFIGIVIFDVCTGPLFVLFGTSSWLLYRIFR